MKTRCLFALWFAVVPIVAHAAPEATSSATSGIWPMLLSLVLILAGFVGVAWLMRRYLPGLGKQGVVKVIGATMVGPRERVVVVEVDDTWLLLGVGAGQVRLLDKRAKPAVTLHGDNS